MISGYFMNTVFGSFYKKPHSNLAITPNPM
jgi:hypothetical protein